MVVADRPRRGSHRAFRPLWAALAPGAISLAAVGGLVAAVNLVPHTGAASAPQPPHGIAAKSTLPSPRPTTPEDHPQGPSARPGTESPPSQAVAPSLAPPRAPGRAPGVSSVPVVVLNQTRVRGLAARLAQDLRAAGWQVTGVGNFRGTVPATTVYYPPGMSSAAAVLAALVPGTDRTRPRFGNLARHRLTVVLTRSIDG